MFCYITIAFFFSNFNKYLKKIMPRKLALSLHAIYLYYLRVKITFPKHVNRSL